jgi:hypothetical protein
MRAVSIGFAFLTMFSPFAKKPHRPAVVRHEVAPLHVTLEIEPPLQVVHAPAVTAAPVVVKPKPAIGAAPPPDFQSAVARSMVALPICRKPGGPIGPGRAAVTFDPSGSVQVLLAPPYAGTAAGACVARRVGNAAQPFDGLPVTFAFRFEL